MSSGLWFVTSLTIYRYRSRYYVCVFVCVCVCMIDIVLVAMVIGGSCEITADLWLSLINPNQYQLGSPSAHVPPSHPSPPTSFPYLFVSFPIIIDMGCSVLHSMRDYNN